MSRRIYLLLAGLLAVTASAIVVEVQLPYKELRLKDGTALGAVTLKSFNTVAGTATVLVDKNLISVKMSLLPDDVAAKIRELTPVQSKEELEAERQQAVADQKAAAEKAGHRQEQAEADAKADRDADRALNVKTAELAQTKPDALLEQVAKTAESRARSYFKYQPQPGSVIGAVTDMDLQLDDPVPVPGWTGRYRVCGTANRQYINNRSSGYDRDSKNFEILVDTAEGKRPKVVDITVK
jgi:hypothetical protein